MTSATTRNCKISEEVRAVLIPATCVREQRTQIVQDFKRCTSESIFSSYTIASHFCCSLVEAIGYVDKKSERRMDDVVLA